MILKDAEGNRAGTDKKEGYAGGDRSSRHQAVFGCNFLCDRSSSLIFSRPGL
jgi:hypothetical protein